MTDNKIYTFEDMLQALVTTFQAHANYHWHDGDLINNYFRLQDVKRMPLGKIAEHLRCSKAFVSMLVTSAKFYPEDVREAYTDHPWSWFVEVMRMPDAKNLGPMDACNKYEGYSLRELKDLRATLSGTSEKKVRIVITLMPDKARDLFAGAGTEVTFVAPNGRPGIAKLIVTDNPTA